MNTVEIMKESWRTLWSQKKLWFFGLFVAMFSGGGGGGKGSEGTAESGAAALPEWLIPVMIGAGLVALALMLMHIISEGALIDGVQRTQEGEGEAYRLGLGMRVGMHYFWRVLLVKLCWFVALFLSLGLISVPLVLHFVKIVPLWLGAGLTVLLVLPGIPWLLTLYFLYEYALRFVVLEGATTRDALRQGWQFLHGRLGHSLGLLIASLLGTIGASGALFLYALPCVGIGYLVYRATSLVPALITGGTLFFPVVLVVLGALGTYRSSVWTLGFLHSPSNQVESAS